MLATTGELVVLTLRGTVQKVEQSGDTTARLCDKMGTRRYIRTDKVFATLHQWPAMFLTKCYTLVSLPPTLGYLWGRSEYLVIPSAFPGNLEI